MPRLPVEAMPTATDAGGIALRGRYGDPGLSSRISLLEMQFRRLLTCSPIKLDELERAPAGPGVLLLTDADLTSYYYVESCQTLRIAIPAVLRGGASKRGGDSIKPALAEHLGIPEARVGKYLAEHCVIRWLQLDEGASHFAHFVTAILRPSAGRVARAPVENPANPNFSVRSHPSFRSPFCRSTPKHDRSPQPAGQPPCLPSNYTSSKT